MNLSRELRRARLGLWACPHGKTSDTPAPVDPYTTAAAQTAQNENTASYNKVLNGGNSTNMFGTVQQTQTGTDPTTGAPIYQSQSTPNSSMQQILSGLLGQAGNSSSTIAGATQGLQGLTGQYSGLNGQLSAMQPQYSADTTALNGVASNLAGTNVSSNVQNAEDAYMKSATGYLDPQWSQAADQNNAQLAAQGISSGSDAYNNNQTLFNNSKTQAYQQAQDAAITSGTNLGINEQNAASTSANAQTNAYANSLSGLAGQTSNLGQQSTNLGAQGNNLMSLINSSGAAGSQLASLFGLTPGNSTTTSSSNPTDISSLIQQQYNQQLNSDNASNAANNQTDSGLASAAASAAMIAMMM